MLCVSFRLGFMHEPDHRQDQGRISAVRVNAMYVLHCFLTAFTFYRRSLPVFFPLFSLLSSLKARNISSAILFISSSVYRTPS